MTSDIHTDWIFEAMLKQAVLDNFDRELTEIEKDPDIPVSDRHKKKMEAIFVLHRRKNRAKVFLFWSKRLAALAAAFFVVFGCALLFVPGVRASVSDALVRWQENFTQFGQSGGGSMETIHWNPTYVPVGYRETSRTRLGEIEVVRYGSADGQILEFKYTTIDNTIATNNEGVEYRQVLRNDIVYHTFSAMSDEVSSAVVWDTDGYLFKILGRLPLEDLLKMAQAVERD